ncbi:MAG: lysylphosphatidylglycerol synthase transmembrane domain-containing protein [Tissierellia bacterium]|nr:lysylphosphatidylglycerol synthase transmembrane domain-containing protein [Tissierellia bacterium]
MKDKKNLYKVLGVLVVSLLSMVFLWQKSQGEHLGMILKSINPIFLLAGGGAFFVYLSMEALAFRYLLKNQGYDISIWRGIGYTLSDSFFSNISPGGSAGQPGQFYYMHRDGISSAACMMSLVAFNSMYHVGMLIIMVFAYFIGATSFVLEVKGMKAMVIFGILCQVFFVLFQCGMMFSNRFLPNMVRKFFKIVKKYPKLHKISEKEEDFLEQVDLYQSYGKSFKERPMIFVRVLLYDIVLLVALYSVSYWVYRGLGFQQYSILEIIALQSVITIAVESLPLPGGVGVSEGSLLAIYSQLIPSSYAFGWMLVTRSLSFYTGLVFGGIVVFSMKKLFFKEEVNLKQKTHGKKKSLQKVSSPSPNY